MIFKQSYQTKINNSNLEDQYNFFFPFFLRKVSVFLPKLTHFVQKYNFRPVKFEGRVEPTQYLGLAGFTGKQKAH